MSIHQQNPSNSVERFHSTVQELSTLATQAAHNNRIRFECIDDEPGKMPTWAKFGILLFSAFATSIVFFLVVYALTPIH
jgi:hypothetical protein